MLFISLNGVKQPPNIGEKKEYINKLKNNYWSLDVK